MLNDLNMSENNIQKPLLLVKCPLVEGHLLPQESLNSHLVLFVIIIINVENNTSY